MPKKKNTQKIFWCFSKMLMIYTFYWREKGDIMEIIIKNIHKYYHEIKKNIEQKQTLIYFKNKNMTLEVSQQFKLFIQSLETVLNHEKFKNHNQILELKSLFYSMDKICEKLYISESTYSRYISDISRIALSLAILFNLI
jgi:hypothetical protein